MKKKKVLKGKQIKKQKEVETTTQVWKVRIESTNGQSVYANLVLDATYFSIEPRELIKSIAGAIRKRHTTLKERLYVECNHQQIKLSLIATILKRDPRIYLSARPSCQAVDWGFNVSLKLVKVPVKRFLLSLSSEV